MKKKIALSLISSFIVTGSAFADFSMMDPIDFTGEAYFAPAVPTVNSSDTITKKTNSKETIPPLKNLRLRLEERAKYRDAINYELAPTAKDLYESETVDTNNEVSKYASSEEKEVFEEKFEDEVNLDAPKEKKKKVSKKKKTAKKQNGNNIILDCEKVDYDTDKYVIYATGNVNVNFVKQGAVVKADVITFDRINNTVKAEGNVKIIKGGQTIVGDYIFLDLNEETALIENPTARTANIEINSKKGYVYSDRIVQEDGSIYADKSFPIDFRSRRNGPRTSRMMIPKGATLKEDMEKGEVKVKVNKMTITQKGEHEILSLKKIRVFKNDKTIFKYPSAKLYTNKNHDYIENAGWEIGSYRGLGAYIGPGFVFELPKGSVLRVMPSLNYKSEFGYGALARFSSGTNHTVAGYGTVKDKLILHGKQQLDDNLNLIYGSNAYMDEWFLGRRRPKYGAALVYSKEYSTNNFLLPNKRASFKHRFDSGYYQDLDYDRRFEKLKGTNTGTARFRYMAEGRQRLYQYKNRSKLTSIDFDIVGQVSTALYGTGDTLAIARIAPSVTMQYKRWMQELRYYFSASDGQTPLRAFDTYRYGKEAFQIREYLRVNKYLTVSWFGNINTSNDSPNGRTFQENAFYFLVGPDDFKLIFGYDFIRQNLRCMVEIMTDAKGTKLEYDTFEIKQEKKAEKQKAPAKQKDSSFEYAPTQPKVLQRAVVENVKVMEDVL